jgi:hypothetical protein
MQHENKKKEFFEGYQTKWTPLPFGNFPGK